MSSDAALGATCDGRLGISSYTPSTGVYNNSELPDTVLTGGTTGSTVAASINIYSASLSNNGNNNLFLSLSNQANASTSGAIKNNLGGSSYVAESTVSFAGGTKTTAGTDPVASVKVTGLLTLDGGSPQTHAGIRASPLSMEPCPSSPRQSPVQRFLVCAVRRCSCAAAGPERWWQ